MSQSSPTGTRSPGITGRESWNMSRVKRVTWRWSQNPRKVTRVFPEEGSLTRGVKARAGQEGCLPDGEDAGPKKDEDSSWRVEGRHGRQSQETHTHSEGDPAGESSEVGRRVSAPGGNLGWV